RKLAVVTDTAAVLVKVTEAAQHLLRAPYGAVFLTNHTAGDLDLAYVHGLTDRDAVQLMRVCAGKVTADTTSPVTVEIQDAPWLRAVCTPIILAGRLQGIRRADIMASTDGGALLVMLSMATQASAKKFVSRLLQQLQEDATLGHLLQSDAGPPLRAGIATFPDDAVNGAELIFAAQNAVESTDRQHPVVCAADLDAEPGPVR